MIKYMSHEIYTVDKLKELNRNKFNYKIIIPKNINNNIKYKIAMTWENSGSLDGKSYVVIPSYYDLNNPIVRKFFKLW